VVTFVEAASVAVLLLFFALTQRRALWAALGIGLGAVLGEEICIRAYGAYQYSPAWSLFLDRVPLAVALIWPAVVLSARAVVRTLWPSGGPVAVGALVCFDAALIEPIATHAGLWSWNLPGFFAVPLIGIAGWGCYGAAASFVLDRLPARAGSGKAAAAGSGAVALVAPLLAHAGILSLWWGALRWWQAPIPPRAAIAGALALSAGASLLLLRSPRRLPWREAVPRACAAALFGALLLLRPDALLAVYAAAFALFWLLALDYRRPAL
jgi:hypothetical protein